jgi:hypothetical protein
MYTHTHARTLECSQQVESNELGGLHSVLDRQTLADFALDKSACAPTRVITEM